MLHVNLSYYHYLRHQRKWTDISSRPILARDTVRYSSFAFPSSSSRSALKSPNTSYRALQGFWLMANMALSIFKSLSDPKYHPTIYHCNPPDASWKLMMLWRWGWSTSRRINPCPPPCPSSRPNLCPPHPPSSALTESWWLPARDPEADPTDRTGQVVVRSQVSPNNIPPQSP